MPTTSNIEVDQGQDWTQIGGTSLPFVIQHVDDFKILGMAFSDNEPSLLTTGHPLRAGEKESGIIGSQLWVRSTSGTVIVILTE